MSDVPPADSDAERRWVKRRKQFLAAHGLRDSVAEAAAWYNLGYTRSGVARRMDVTEGTARGYFDKADAGLPGSVSVTFHHIDGDPEYPIEKLPDPAQKECPCCRTDNLWAPWAAKEAFPRWSNWGATKMLEDADRVCAYCHVVKIDGEWQRMEALGSRVNALANASDSKSRGDFRDKLTSGIDPGSGSGSGGKAADGDDFGLDL